jgi:omega-amidase
MKLNLSLGQMQISYNDAEANFERVRAWTAEAARRGSALALFPELWYSGYDLEQWPRSAAPLGEGLFARLSALARERHIALGGSVLELKDGHPYNTFVLFDAEGQCRAVYRKLHLFGPMGEDQWLRAGDSFTLLAGEWGPVGLSICYDLRFPEVARHYALQGARLWLLPAQWPVRRIRHWQTLLRARAIENQMFVAGVNGVGPSGSETFGGLSAVIEPWGEPVAEAGGSEVLLTVEIDLDQADEARRRFPVLKDRRADVYGG